MQAFDPTAEVSSWMIAEDNQLPGFDADSKPPSVSFITATQLFIAGKSRDAAGEITMAIQDSLAQSTELAGHIAPLPVVAEILLSVRSQEELPAALSNLRLAINGVKRIPRPENVRRFRVRALLDPRASIDTVPVAEAFSLPVVLEEGF